MTGQRGAYGFQLVYPDWGEAVSDLVELDGSAPAVTIDWRHACTIKTHDYADDERLSMGARGASSFHVRRRPPGITFDLQAPPTPDALIHPLGTVPLAALARWRGDAALHAGAFATTTGAWALAGAREAGKSTMLATLGRRGHPVVADDLLAVQDGWVWSGPHCVDLRPDVAERFSSARNLGRMGLRPRFRLSTPPAPARIRLRGLFLLDWNDESKIAITPLSIEERLQWLYRLEYIALLGPADPRAILDLAALPAWRLKRPRDWAATDDAVDAMLALTDQVN